MTFWSTSLPLRHSSLLTVFTFRRGADNEVMGVLGRHCHLLQEFNVTGSNRVTDEGILAFLGVGSREVKTAFQRILIIFSRSAAITRVLLGTSRAVH